MVTSRKDYGAAAALIGRAANEPINGSDRVAVLVRLIGDFSEYFASDNTLFSRDKFRDAAWEAYRINGEVHPTADVKPTEQPKEWR